MASSSDDVDPCEVVPGQAVSTCARFRPSSDLDGANASSRYLGCEHYERACLLVSPCCDREFVCRHCHNEASDHTLDRYNVTRLRCMRCGTIQPKATTCQQCNLPFARYSCLTCSLFSNSTDQAIFHCEFCNVCRLAGDEHHKAVHCHDCGCCVYVPRETETLTTGWHHDEGIPTCPLCQEPVRAGYEPNSSDYNYGGGDDTDAEMIDDDVDDTDSSFDENAGGHDNMPEIDEESLPADAQPGDQDDVQVVGDQDEVGAADGVGDAVAQGEPHAHSRQSVVQLRCGCTMHADCYDRHTRTEYTCPLCKLELISTHDEDHHMTGIEGTTRIGRS